MPTVDKEFQRPPLPRVRHHVSPQIYLPIDRQFHVPDWYPPVIEAASWSEWFLRGGAPTVLDIGCGRGRMLLDYAASRPDLQILGIEIRKPLVEWISAVIDGESIPNAYALWYSVANGLDFIEAGSIDHAFYLFPDPWPKKRHVKRRAFTPSFVNMVFRVLRDDGFLYLATDRPDVDAWQLSILQESGLFDVEDVTDDAMWPHSFITDQQDFCHRKGIPYVRRRARKRSGIVLPFSHSHQPLR